MPLYDYHCRACGKSFELLRRLSDADAKAQCPDCDSYDVQRLLSTFSSAACISAPPGGGFR